MNEISEEREPDATLGLVLYLFSKQYWYSHQIKGLPRVRIKDMDNKALHYKLFFLKALSKRLWKLTIKTKRLSQLKSLSFLNFND